MPIKDALADYDKMIGQRLRLGRIRKSVSQEKLAAGIVERLMQITGEHETFSFQQLQKYENGTNRIAASTLMLIADILETPTAFFLKDTEKWAPREDPVLSVPDFGAQTLRAIVALEKLSSKTVSRFIKLFEDLAREEMGAK